MTDSIARKSSTYRWQTPHFPTMRELIGHHHRTSMQLVRGKAPRPRLPVLCSLLTGYSATGASSIEYCHGIRITPLLESPHNRHNFLAGTRPHR